MSLPCKASSTVSRVRRKRVADREVDVEVGELLAESTGLFGSVRCEADRREGSLLSSPAVLSADSA
jgi:hypothetical protein